MTTYKVGYFVGSLSAKSINRILSRALIRVAPPGLEFHEIPIKDLPLYNHDHDADYPPEGRALKEAIAASDAILFVTPEYNRSIPGGLKNAIDWASPLSITTPTKPNRIKRPQPPTPSTANILVSILQLPREPLCSGIPKDLSIPMPH